MPVRDLLSAASGASAPADPYFYDVSLLLNGDGTNGAQNNTFLDSSTNNFTITRNGNTTQGSFSPYGPLWSNYFNQSAFLASAATGVSNFGTGNYTFECWVNPSTVSVANGIYDGRPAGNGAYFTTIINTSAKFFLVANGGTVYTSSTSLIANTWTHVALVRGGTGSNQCAVFINGSRDGTFTDATSYTDSKQVIGATAYSPYGVNPFTGYISNMRIVKGTDVYGYSNTTITVPTSPLTAVSGTSLLTCQSNRFIDNSTNNIALSVVNSGLAVQRFSPFNPTAPYSTSVIGGSGYFDGSSSLTVPSTSALSFGTGNFTIECWVNFASVPSNAVGIIDGQASYTPSFYYDGGTYSANKLVLSDRTANQISVTWIPTAGVWYHLAAVRNGTTYTIYINGSSIGTATGSNSYSGTATYTIGGDSGGGSSWGFPGYISNLRVTGSAIYNSNFTPPTAPLTAITNTQLLTSMTNAGIPDLAMQNDLQTVGSAQVSTSVKKYGTGSLKFNGTTDDLYLPSSPQYALDGGDFTVECWVYLNSYQSTAQARLFFPTGNNQNCDIGGNGSAPGKISYYNGTGGVNSPSGTIPLSTWTHIAWVRSGGTVNLYANGSRVGTGSIAATSPSATPVYIGSTGSADWLDGYVDDLRITKGYARYTGTTYTVPTASLPTY